MEYLLRILNFLLYILTNYYLLKFPKWKVGKIIENMIENKYQSTIFQQNYFSTVRNTAQENVMNAHEETRLFLVVVNQPKNMIAISTRQTIIW